MRPGHLDRGEQNGAWTTYDQSGDVYKVTMVKPKADTGFQAGRQKMG